MSKTKKIIIIIAAWIVALLVLWALFHYTESSHPMHPIIGGVIGGLLTACSIKFYYKKE